MSTGKVTDVSKDRGVVIFRITDSFTKRRNVSNRLSVNMAYQLRRLESSSFRLLGNINIIVKTFSPLRWLSFDGVETL